MSMIDKNHPSPEWIASLRKRFPVEREIDHILTRKMERRGGVGFSPIPLPTLSANIETLLGKELKESFQILDARWLSGGSSKLQMAFTLDWNRPGVGREKTPMVLRMEPAESMVETSRLREYQVIKAFEGIVPVPPVFWVDAEGEHLPYPGLIYGFAQGVTKPTTAKSGVAGLGTQLDLELRQKLAPQFIDHLGKVHTRDFTKAGLDAFDVPQLGTQAAEWAVNWWERVWEEDSDEDSPLMRLAAIWLRENMPVCNHLSILHADFRVGNFLFTEHDTRITAWLDWELTRIGDRHQDLAWTTSKAFGGYAEDGKTFLVGGLLPEQEFFDAYSKASGLGVDRKTLHYYKVFNAYMMSVLTTGTGYRIARNGKTHQDVLVTWLLGVGYMLQDEVRTLIEETD